MFDSEQVANYFIKKSFDEGVPLTPMKLIKLVYIAHGWYRGLYHEDLINDAVEAWRYGPVIPDLYHKIKHYGRGHIYAPIEGYSAPSAFDDEKETALMDQVWNSYNHFDAYQLSAMTHQHGTPWSAVWNRSGGGDYSGSIIPNSLIEDHYAEKARGQ